MKPAPFEYSAPSTLDEALAVLADLGDEAKVLAGGQSLIPMLALRLTRFERLVDLNGIAELRGVSVNGTARVGAMTRQHEAGAGTALAAAVPLLARATPLIGHFQIRNRGTVGGSIAHADPAAEYPAVALALDATMEVAGPGGRRDVPAREFFTGTWTTALEAEEVLAGVRFPVWTGSCGFAVEEVARRHGDFAIAGAACAVEVAAGTITRAAVALFGMGSTPLRAEAAEAGLVGSAGTEVDVEEAGRTAVEGLDPPADIHASSRYRTKVGATVVSRALVRALEEANRG